MRLQRCQQSHLEARERERTRSTQVQSGVSLSTHGKLTPHTLLTQPGCSMACQCHMDSALPASTRA
eukprot:3050394-Alexandrium_andersonii.AAC.1